MNLHYAKSVFRPRATREATASASQRCHKSQFSRGQSAVEFAMISTVALVLMVIGIQYALIGQAAVAVNQGAAALARYAAASPGNVVASGKDPANGTVTITPGSALAQLLPSSLLTSTTTGSGKSAVTTPDLTVTIASTAAAGGTTSAPVFGDQLTISFSYATISKIALPSAFLLGITFPSNLTSSSTQLYE